jgi:hypothetical protein
MRVDCPNCQGQIEIPRQTTAQVLNISLPSAPEKPPQPHVPPPLPPQPPPPPLPQSTQRPQPIDYGLTYDDLRLHDNLSLLVPISLT